MQLDILMLQYQSNVEAVNRLSVDTSSKLPNEQEYEYKCSESGWNITETKRNDIKNLIERIDVLKNREEVINFIDQEIGLISNNQIFICPNNLQLFIKKTDDYVIVALKENNIKIYSTRWEK